MKTSLKTALILVLVLLTLALSTAGVAFAQAAGILFAAPVVVGSGDCSSWANACTLQTALAGAISGDEIWVAAGTHRPTTGADRTATFQLKDGVALYGGFAGTETARDQRDFDANVTILSGDLLGDDTDNVAHDEPTRAENSYHVVVGSGTDNTAVLDGFIVTGGNANDDYVVPCNLGCGSGMYNFSGSPTLRNVIFSANTAAYDGGGMFNSGSSPALTNVTFSSNSAGNQGGGIFNVNNSNPTLKNVNVTANTAYEGGGMLNYLSNPMLTNMVFSGNSASLDGGGMYNAEGNPTLTNVTFSDNSASSYGGGMLNGYSSPTLMNVTFSANSAGSQGGGMYNLEGSPTLNNVIIANSLGGDCDSNGTEEGGLLNPASSHNLIQDEFNGCGLTDGINGNIVGSDPLLGPLADNGGLTQTHALLSGSPAIDAGTNIGCPSTDQRGVSRPQGPACEMGAYEAILTYHTVTFDGNGGGTPSPTSKSVTFGSAYGTLATVSRAGYTFNGWYDAASGGNLVTAATIVTTASDHSLYAQWTANTYTVTFDGNGGGTPAPTSMSVTYGSPYGTLATVSRAGYTFNGWYDAASGGNLVTAATLVTTASNHSLHAQWTANTYTVTFDGNGGGTPSPTSKVVTYDSAYGTLATVSRAGYAFNGWYDAASGGNLVTEATIVTTTSDHSLYAQWTALTGPDKIAPAAAGSDISLNPTLSWNPLIGASGYEYCYSSAPGPCTKWNSVGSDTSVALNGLAPNYTYYWQVRAVDAGGTTEADGGTWWSFTTTAASACTWPPYTAPATPTFGDVPMDVGHWSWVERLANSTITAGCGAGNYCPFSEVVRAQMAIFLLRGKHCGSSYTPPAVGASTGFNDVPLDASYAPWVKQLAAEGVTAGCGNGNFCPLQVVNRAQMAIFLLRTKHGSTYSPPAVGATTGFNDVPLDATYAAWVKQLAAEGITAGCGGGNFCPLQNVNRAQMATFLVRAFGLP